MTDISEFTSKIFKLYSVIFFRHYIAYFPRIFRTGITENVVVSTQGFPNNVNVTVKVLDAKVDTRVVAEVKETLAPGNIFKIVDKFHNRVTVL